MSIKRILIVEDDGISAVMFARMLEQMGYQPFQLVASGEEAVNLVRAGIAARVEAGAADPELSPLPDLVLMDIGLAGEMDGIAAARLIRQESGLPVIYLTSYNDPATLTSARPYLPHEYLPKPCQPEQLRAAIEMSLYQHELEKRIRRSETRYRRMVELANEGMGEIDARHHIVFVNDKLAEMLGYAPQELIGHPLEHFILPTQLDDHRRRMQERRAGLPGHYLRHFLRKDGIECIFQVSANGLFDEQDQFTGAFALFTDITERIREETAVRRSEALYRQMFTGHSAVMLLIDPDSGKIVDANPAAAAYYGYPVKALRGMNISQINALPAGQVDVALQQVLREGKNYFNFPHRLASGEVRLVEVYTVPIHTVDGSLLYSIVHDVNERQQAEQAAAEHAQALQESEERYRALIEASPMSILVVQQGRYTLANPAAERLLGYAPGELVGVPILDTIHPDSHALVQQRSTNLAAGQAANPATEMKVLRKDGRAVFTESASVVVRLAGQPAILIVSQDITARKHMEDALRESEERLQLALSGSKTGVWEFDEFTGCFTLDREVTRLLGLPPQATQVDWKTFVTLIHPDDLAQKQPRFLQALATDGEWGDEYRVFWPDGSLHWLYASGHISRSEHGSPTRILGISFDITERKRAEEKLRQALAEKETLLKEVHHRVKNNLTTIISLLALQSDIIQDEAARQVLFDSRQRVFSMALVHEELYRSEDLSHIDFGAYLSKLAQRLVNTYSTNPNIRLVVDVQETRLILDKAIPIGQLVNELLTNALKHAFPGGRAGTLRVSLSGDADTLRLSVADDGIGLPPDLDIDTASTLGMQLIAVLARQVKGVLQICRGQAGQAGPDQTGCGQAGRGQGTEFVLSLPRAELE